MSNLNHEVKEKLGPDVLTLADWSHQVMENTMDLLQREMTVAERNTLSLRFTYDEREEARKFIAEYGLGKPARIIEHRGNKKQPICFETEIVSTHKQLKEPDTQTIDAEYINITEPAK